MFDLIKSDTVHDLSEIASVVVYAYFLIKNPFSLLFLAFINFTVIITVSYFVFSKFIEYYCKNKIKSLTRFSKYQFIYNVIYRYFNLHIQ